jgi:hypothetical protein
VKKAILARSGRVGSLEKRETQGLMVSRVSLASAAKKATPGSLVRMARLVFLVRLVPLVKREIPESAVKKETGAILAM